MGTAQMGATISSEKKKTSDNETAAMVRSWMRRRMVPGPTLRGPGRAFHESLSILMLFWIIVNTTRRLPLRAVFLVTSLFLFLMGLKFVGEGLLSPSPERLTKPDCQFEIRASLKVLSNNRQCSRSR